ncbi:MAG: hypothetical protein ROZ00_05070 [Denitratisoma sp.]|nr:hypothetical protein [Denitratisoma sp.]
MRHPALHAGRALAVAITVILVGGSALADKPAWAGSGKNGKPERAAREKQTPARHERLTPAAGVYFADRHRTVASGYYAERFRTGHCPPGLAKKNNGCLPPGQAKKWAIGQPLPRGVIFYDLPPALVVELGPPPPRHRYVRVAADILLIAIGTGMVVDALQDLGNM